MTMYITPGDMVEGKKCHVMTRKYEFKRLQKDPITKKNMVMYELDRNCSVEITQCMELSENDLHLRLEKKVGMQLGDCLTGDAIQMYIDTFRPVTFTVKEGQSGRHGACLVDTKKRTIGKLKYNVGVFNKLLGFSPNSITEK